jgi:4-amino-4-deoxy-L-arabinose transferase-like glycosyltransferase
VWRAPAPDSGYPEPDGARTLARQTIVVSASRRACLSRPVRADPDRPRQLLYRRHLRVLIGRVSRGVWVILVIALVLRLTTVALTFKTPATLDPHDFSRTAGSIAQGHGYPSTNRGPGGGPTAFRPPSYPLFLAGIYAVVGHPAPAIGRLAGAFLGALSVALVGLIAMRLWGKRVGWLALGIAAIAPPMVILSTALISEALFVPIVLAAVLAALEGGRSTRRYLWAIVTGVLVGIASLTRTNGLLLLLPFALAFAPTHARRRFASWAPSVALVLAAVLAIAPWTVRNWIVFHAFIPVSDEIGYTLAGTYNHVSRADRRLPAIWIEAENGASPEYARILAKAKRERWNELTYGDHLQSAAIADIESDPAYVLKVGLWNTIRMFHIGELSLAAKNLHDTDIPLGPASVEISSFPLLGVLALGGLFTRRARRAPKWLWIVPACLATTVFVTGFIRFRSPIDPFLVMLAALLIADLAEPLGRHRGSQQQPKPSRPDELARTQGGHQLFSSVRSAIAILARRRQDDATAVPCSSSASVSEVLTSENIG